MWPLTRSEREKLAERNTRRQEWGVRVILPDGTKLFFPGAVEFAMILARNSDIKDQLDARKTQIEFGEKVGDVFTSAKMLKYPLEEVT